MIDLELRPKTAITAAIDDGRGDVCESLDELSALLSNLGVRSVARAVQRRRMPDPSVYIGRGKAEEIKAFASTCGADTLVVDGFMSPMQRGALEKLTGLEVWDRAFVIMMIFEQRAVTSEAKLQVELAMLRREIPSLKGLGHQMSRLGGGIGTRGPGETEFVRHKRKLERRIKFIEKDLANVRRRRGRSRERSVRAGEPLVSLVGYTNGGKTSLLRRLSRDTKIQGEDKLFATLDTITRRVDRPGIGAFMLSDTVGFIRRLPPELIDAFRATLEAVSGADMLIVVVDASDREPMKNFETVRDTLAQIGAGDLPRIVALNKTDLAPEESVFVAAGLASLGEEVVKTSAATGEGEDELIARVAERLASMRDAATAREDRSCTRA